MASESGNSSLQVSSSGSTGQNAFGAYGAATTDSSGAITMTGLLSTPESSPENSIPHAWPMTNPAQIPPSGSTPQTRDVSINRTQNLTFSGVSQASTPSEAAIQMRAPLMTTASRPASPSDMSVFDIAHNQFKRIRSSIPGSSTGTSRVSTPGTMRQNTPPVIGRVTKTQSVSVQEADDGLGSFSVTTEQTASIQSVPGTIAYPKSPVIPLPGSVQLGTGPDGVGNNSGLPGPMQLGIGPDSTAGNPSPGPITSYSPEVERNSSRRRSGRLGAPYRASSPLNSPSLKRTSPQANSPADNMDVDGANTRGRPLLRAHDPSRPSLIPPMWVQSIMPPCASLVVV